MKKYTFLRFFLVSFLTVLLIEACTSFVDESVVLESKAEAVGPFFEGPNSLIAEYEVDVNQLIGSESYSLKDLEEVKIEGITVNLAEEDSMSMTSFTSASLSIVSENEALTSIAIVNPISSTSNTLEMSSSEEVDLAPFFKEGNFTLVLDWDFNEDDYSEQMSSQITMNLNLKLESK